jgi:hypothetical protein
MKVGLFHSMLGGMGNGIGIIFVVMIPHAQHIVICYNCKISWYHNVVKNAIRNTYDWGAMEDCTNFNQKAGLFKNKHFIFIILNL